MTSRTVRARDEGSAMLLALMFAFMLGALVTVAAATVLSGLNKTEFARDFSTSQQTADAAVDQALVLGNLHGLATLPPGDCTPAADPSLPVTHCGWTPGTLNGNRIDLLITIDTPSGEREYTATLERFQVAGGEPSTDGTGAVYTAPSTTNLASNRTLWRTIRGATLVG